jgi:type I restriction enzyme, S subunit
MLSREMKDSGVEWIGEIPKDWTISKIGSHYIERKAKVSDMDYEPLSVTKGGVVPQLDTAAKSSDHNNRKLVLKDDFVINSRSDRKMSAGIAYSNGSVSVINTVIYSNTMFKEYTKYLLKNYSFAEEFYRWGSGIVADLWSTKWDKMKNISIPVPEISEQEKIAKRIDTLCNNINNLINETKKSIEELKKYKQSIITEAVTKGLNPNVEMKDSGIEWIGKIPVNWTKSKMKHLGHVRNGLTYSPEQLTDKNDGTLVLRAGNIKNGKLIIEDKVYVKMDNIPKELLIKAGDILICSRSGSRSLIGKNTIIEEDIDASFGAFMMVFKSHVVDGRYIYYLLNSGIFSYYIGSFLTSTINQLTIGNFNNMQIVYTEDLKEQQEIVSYLNSRIEKIDILIINKEKVIDELEKYKKSLIYEYVTGKKDV